MPKILNKLNIIMSLMMFNCEYKEDLDSKDSNQNLKNNQRILKNIESFYRQQYLVLDLLKNLNTNNSEETTYIRDVLPYLKLQLKNFTKISNNQSPRPKIEKKFSIKNSELIDYHIYKINQRINKNQIPFIYIFREYIFSNDYQVGILKKNLKKATGLKFNTRFVNLFINDLFLSGVISKKIEIYNLSYIILQKTDLSINNKNLQFLYCMISDFEKLDYPCNKVFNLKIKYQSNYVLTKNNQRIKNFKYIYLRQYKKDTWQELVFNSLNWFWNLERNLQNCISNYLPFSKRNINPYFTNQFQRNQRNLIKQITNKIKNAYDLISKKKNMVIFSDIIFQTKLENVGFVPITFRFNSIKFLWILVLKDLNTPFMLLNPKLIVRSLFLKYKKLQTIENLKFLFQKFNYKYSDALNRFGYLENSKQHKDNYISYNVFYTNT